MLTGDLISPGQSVRFLTMTRIRDLKARCIALSGTTPNRLGVQGAHAPVRPRNYSLWLFVISKFFVLN